MTVISNNTTRLNDTQLVLLSAASQRQDRQVLRPETITERAFARAINALVKHGLVAAVELGSKQSEQGGYAVEGSTLVITSAGLTAIGCPEPEQDPWIGKGRRNKELPSRLMPPIDAADHQGPTTKRALIIAMLSREEGATLDDLIAATGWLRHTTRAALTGLRQKGFCLARIQTEDRTSFYRIVAADGRDQAA